MRAASRLADHRGFNMASLFDWLNPQQPQPQYDQYGVQLPGPQQTDMGKHYQDVLGGQQLDPDQLQIILQMLGMEQK